MRSARNGWASGYIAFLESKDISVVRTPSLDVQAPITRGALLQMLLEILNVRLTTLKIPYSDVPRGSRFFSVIAQATADGIVSGDAGKSTFRPHDAINRAEAAKIIFNAMQKYAQ
jgi:hypothetical protein